MKLILLNPYIGNPKLLTFMLHNLISIFCFIKKYNNDFQLKNALYSLWQIILFFLAPQKSISTFLMKKLKHYLLIRKGYYAEMHRKNWMKNYQILYFRKSINIISKNAAYISTTQYKLFCIFHSYTNFKLCFY